MRVKRGTNLSASVHARLLNRAKTLGRPFHELLQYYAMERFLFRLSVSPYRTRFVLKGALMLHVWDAPLARATRDLDFLGRLENSLENLERAVRDVCLAEVQPDGMRYDLSALRTERIKEDADYEGVRVRFVGMLGNARVPMQLDVGFGDVVTPEPSEISYPALLDFPAPSLTGYTRETVVAEKFHAMIYLGRINSRMKDFYDIWLLARRFSFSGSLLREAVQATFRNRATGFDLAPVAFSAEFVDQASTCAQWTAFRGRVSYADCPETLAEVALLLQSFLVPVAAACADALEFDEQWLPGGPWTSRN